MDLKVLCLFSIALCCSLLTLSSAAVISIDFGSEWVKVALVKVSHSIKYMSDDHISIPV